jgi:hypothetical protein
MLMLMFKKPAFQKRYYLISLCFAFVGSQWFEMGSESREARTIKSAGKTLFGYRSNLIESDESKN